VCRDKLFAELKEDILEMAKSKYAHFFVQKMLRYGTKEQRAYIFKTMEGNIAKVDLSHCITEAIKPKHCRRNKCLIILPANAQGSI
jgi:hypothetical protein